VARHLIYTNKTSGGIIMLGSTIDDIIQTAGIVGLAIIALFIGVQKLLKDWKSSSAESNIITLMHTELDRMSEQNTALSTELGRLHSQIILLSQELQKLTLENQQLQAEVIALTKEISALKALTRKDLNGKIKIN
jgi:peptidoglycan hydrolase CwlO-like protein